MPQAFELLQKMSRKYDCDDIEWEELLRLNYGKLVAQGANIIDAGANEGDHTEHFVRDLKAANVAVFEPIPELCRRLARRFAGDPQVAIRELALSDHNGVETFFAFPEGWGESGLRIKEWYPQKVKESAIELPVEVRRLDDIALGFSIDYIKIDIEGGEIDMLVGARDTILQSRPLISTEYGDRAYRVFGHSAGSLYELAREYGYRVADLFGNPFADLEEFLACVDRFYWDYLLLPGEKLAAFEGRLREIRELAEEAPPLMA